MISQKSQRYNIRCYCRRRICRVNPIILVCHVVFAIFCCNLPSSCKALMPPHPEGFYEIQPDGNTTAHIFLRHGKDKPYMADGEGRPIVLDEDGWYIYDSSSSRNEESQNRGRNLRSTEKQKLRVGIDEPPPMSATQVQDLRSDYYPELYFTDNEKNTSSSAQHQSKEEKEERRRLVPKTGEVNCLVLLLKFSDHRNRKMVPKSDYETLFNSPDFDDKIAPTGSVNYLFDKNSFGSYNIKCHVEDWYVVEGTEQTWSFNRNGLLGKFGRIAHSKLRQMDDAGFDFSPFDADNDGMLDQFVIVHSGYGAEAGGTDCKNNKKWGSHRIWSHNANINGDNVWTSKDGSVRTRSYSAMTGLWESCGEQIARVGLLSHEMAHTLELPDLISDNGHGIGGWGLMGMGWGFDYTQYHPGLISAWSKIQLGWVEPIEIAETGTYLAKPSLHHDCIYKIKHGYPEGEYLLLEYRVEESFDQGIGGNGILIWKVDENAKQRGSNSRGHPGLSDWPENGNHYKVALLQADRDYGLEKATDYGDPKDLWTPGMALSAGSNQFPNTDAYQGGNIIVTKNSIQVLKESKQGMEFRFENPDLPQKVVYVTSGVDESGGGNPGDDESKSRKVARSVAKLSSFRKNNPWDRRNRKKRALGIKGVERKKSA